MAVGKPGVRSSVWSVWGSKNSHDVYACIRSSAGVIKYSFHQSGEWIHHLVNPDHPKAKFVTLPSPDSKRLDTWSRPEPFYKGWTHMLSIFVPLEDLPVVPGDDTNPKGVRWIDHGDMKSDAIEIRLLLASGRGPALHLDGHHRGATRSAVVDGFVLTNGEVVIVTATEIPLSPEQLRQLAAKREEQRTAINEEFSLVPSLGPRFAVPMVDYAGNRCIWDMAFTLE
ncbi:hypothetical protein [Rhodococcoides fascians]|uniref:hypothetical protein n=1 Tax=Rhodococcoides fascians TaxID=1828 RepID=UPI0018AFB124|nr:hypothetical protein [Rhodococcus fascians]MDJ0411213.1 hypothetical protein [Rhodococcus fascians]